MQNTNLYSYKLPAKLIATKPTSPRDHARLLVYELKSGKIIDEVFYNLKSYLAPHTTIVVNNSKVEQCRWLFDNGKTEVFVIKRIASDTIEALVRPGKKFKPGHEAKLTSWLNVSTLAVTNEGTRILKLNIKHDDIRLKQVEHVPLPPYIPQDDSLAKEYQTVYARSPGSLAAPTAGLHFTSELLNDLKAQHTLCEITLHVGLGTFAKLSDTNLKTSKLHEETFSINAKNAAILKSSTHITAIGTTSVRCLESLPDDLTGPIDGNTDIFIRPGHIFQRVNSVVTNFHLPGTSLLMLVAALLADKLRIHEAEAAKELMRIYSHAITSGYRFYSFGDAMLIT
jgi:S-adenosylmethionine:tRNA ribosyltransferase-isomerase